MMFEIVIKECGCMRKLTISALFTILVVMEACAPVYIPSARHTHLLDKRGELNGAILTGTNGADLQGAYAVSSRVGVVAAASFGTNDEEGSLDYHEHSYGELALEYFRPFGRIGRFEFLGGGGMGSATSVDNYTFGSTDQQVQATGKYNKLFIQSNIGLETSWIETGVALRLGHVTFTEFETSSTIYRESESGTFFEPALFARMGGKNIKIEGQFGTTGLLQDEQDVAFDYRPLYFSIGMNLNLSPLP